MNTKRVKQKMLQWKRGQRLLMAVFPQGNLRSNINRIWRLADPRYRAFSLGYIRWENSMWRPWEKEVGQRRRDWN
jgi:hypothetical protein|tara:strand:+ start:1461 stop:1685 length:225 start_codon:yes stop_codon:yes gene_type:complete